MEPNQNVMGDNGLNVVSATEQSPVEKKKSGNGMLIGMIVAMVVAVGGIGFGVWAMMDGNSQKEQLNQQISALKQQKDALEKQVEELNEKINKEEDESNFVSEIVAPEWGEAEAVIENGVFTITNADGEFYLQLDDYVIEEILSCDSGTEEAPLPMTCVVKTANGEAKIRYDYDERSLEYTEAAN